MNDLELEQEFTQALAAYQSQHWDEAQRRFQAITQQRPDCKEAWFQLGLMAQHQGQFASAVDCFERVLELDSEIQEVYFQLGQIALQQQQFQMALDYWQRALNINPHYAEARLQTALAYLQLMQTEPAQQSLEKLLQQSPEYKQALFLQARDFELRGQRREGQLLMDVLAQDGDAAALLIQAQTAAQEQDMDSCLKYLERVQPPLGKRLSTLYRSLDNKKDPDAAEAFLKDYQDILAWLPRCPQWYFNGQAQAADRALLQAADWSPAQPAARPTGPRRRKLLWLVDLEALVWQDWTWNYLSALSPRHWEIEVALRTHSLQALLQIPSQFKDLNLSTLPEALSAAAQQIEQSTPDVILWSQTELDAFQFWLSHKNLASVQISGSGSAASSAPEPAVSNAQQAELHTLPYIETLPSEDYASETQWDWLCPISPWGLSPTEEASLRNADSKICLIAHHHHMVYLERIHKRHPERPFVLWQQAPELISQLLVSRGLLYPSWGAAPYLALMQRLGRPVHCLAEEQAEQKNTVQIPRLWPQLPHTQWAVELWHTLTQSPASEFPQAKELSP